MTAFDLIARKQVVGQEDAEPTIMALSVYLDAAKRGQCPPVGANTLTSNMIVACYLAKALKLPLLHKQTMAGFAALTKATEREGEFLNLTTGEHKALSEVLRSYFRILPMVQVGTLTDASRESARLMGISL
jgi:hypothetical protein